MKCTKSVCECACVCVFKCVCVCAGAKATHAFEMRSCMEGPARGEEGDTHLRQGSARTCVRVVLVCVCALVPKLQVITRHVLPLTLRVHPSYYETHVAIDIKGASKHVPSGGVM